MIQRFQQSYAKANTIRFSEYLILELRYALGPNKFMNLANIRNLPNPLIVPLACLAFHSKGRGILHVCLLSIYEPTFLSNAEELLVLNSYL